jgi:hypothetical protein
VLDKIQKKKKKMAEVPVIKTPGTNTGDVYEDFFLPTPADLMNFEKTLFNKCQMQHQQAIKYVKSLVEKIESEEGERILAEDYAKHNLFPGTQIFYTGAFNLGFLRHYGIYVWDGLIVEVGSGPKDCKTRESHFAPTFTKQSFGFSRLDAFEEEAKKKQAGKPAGKVLTPSDGHISTIVDRLNRVIDLLGCWDYSLVRNCQHAANYVTFGNFISQQAEVFLTFATASTVSLLFGCMFGGIVGAACALRSYQICTKDACMPQRKQLHVEEQTTVNDCQCSSPVWKYYTFVGQEWCYVNGNCKRAYTTAAGRRWDYVVHTTPQTGQ